MIKPLAFGDEPNLQPLSPWNLKVFLLTSPPPDVIQGLPATLISLAHKR
jgi:hypothetical protein